MSHAPAPLPDELGDAFSVRSAVAAGVSPGRLRHRGLITPFHGTRMIATRPHGPVDADESPVAREAKILIAELLQRSRAFAQIMPETWFLCGATAAVRYGLPVPLRVLRRMLRDRREAGRIVPARGIDVGAFAPQRSSRAAGVRGRRLSPRLVTVRTVDGIRLSSPVSTWAMLADELTVDELIDLGDAIVHIPRRRGMTRGTPEDALGTVAQLTAAANAPYRPHAGRLQEAAAQIRVGSASVSETRTRLGCARDGLPEPELDYDVSEPMASPSAIPSSRTRGGASSSSAKGTITAPIAPSGSAMSRSTPSARRRDGGYCG